MSIGSPYFMRLGAVAAMTLRLASCGRTESYRYKLTVAVNTPDGVKKASSVVEVTFLEVSIPGRGIMHKLNGEALYLDLGPGARPLIALLTSQPHPKYGKDLRWSRDAGPDDNLLSQLYGPTLPDLLDDVSRIARTRGAHKIAPNDLPNLVTFADMKNPGSVVEVDPNNLRGTLGPGVSWNEITLESTDEPITTGIEKKLFWLPHYFTWNLRLDGSDLITTRELANILGWPDLDESEDSKGIK
jgi:hypothetical protein